MLVLVGLLFLYYINTTLLFVNQSLAVYFAFVLIIIYFKSIYVNIQFSSIHLEWLEWVELFRFFIILKNWNIYYIRFLNYKMYKFYNFVQFIKQSILKLFSLQINKMKQRHKFLSYESGISILNRLEYRIRYLKSAVDKDIFILI